MLVAHQKFVSILVGVLNCVNSTTVDVTGLESSLVVKGDSGVHSNAAALFSKHETL